MNDDQRTLYAGAISCRNAEVALRLARSHSFIFMNFIGLPFAIAQSSPGLQAVAGILGFALGILWLVPHNLTTHRINYWESPLIKLEEVSPTPSSIRVFSGDDYEKAFGKWLRFGNILAALAAVLMLAWAIILGNALRELR